MSKHAFLKGQSNHASTTRTYTNESDRINDIPVDLPIPPETTVPPFQVSENIDKEVKQLQPTPTYWKLVSVEPTVWTQETTDIDQTAIDDNTIHRTSDGSDHGFLDQSLVIGSSPSFAGATLTDAPTVGTDGTNKDYVDAIVNAAIRLQGDWNADTNTPDITGTTTTGFAWYVSVAGSTDLGGITTWAVGDLAVKTDTGWLRIANEDIAALWGNITGTLSNQTDLKNALDLKVTGPASAINASVAIFDGITGKLIQDSGIDIESVGDVFGPVSSLDEEIPLFDGVTGKLLKGSGITFGQITPVNADLGALNQAGVQTLLDLGKAKRINATFSQVSAQQMTTDAAGNAVYAGTNPATVSVISTISGTVSTGTGITLNFYMAKGNTLNAIESFDSGGVGFTTATTSLPHGYSNGDRVLQEDTVFYDNDYTVSNVTATTYDFIETFISTETGQHAKLLLATKASNDFSGSNKNTVVIGHISVVENDFLYLAVENVGNAGEWETADIHELHSRV